MYSLRSNSFPFKSFPIYEDLFKKNGIFGLTKAGVKLYLYHMLSDGYPKGSSPCIYLSGY